ncbi:hypothetical protein HYPDE_23173 [Hyphomicrobium denitrificans 1NES1]|uniref:Sulfotransferase family protein n=1 Tax=Hyphomicrobium denitrificans 1NES1 TaxID=670307 RepID=N0B700_9HYPH|nr:hypothetical protein [Hyphomicrobium denitrificans]AGK56321.1 hypothetical protein HYPDE_23173 [Hyphomicrobium denitrificans 1NES1]
MADPLLVHVHVPKCAGTTIENHLKSQLGDGGMWAPPKRSRRFPLGWFSYKYDPELFVPTKQVRAISGHFIGQSIEKMFPGRRIIRSVILREPESLMLSYYNFRMMRYLREGQYSYSFSLFMRSMRLNPAAHFLLERWAELPWIELARLSEEKKAALLDEMLGTFDFVADIASTNALLASLSTEIGIATTATPQNTAEENQKKIGWKLLRRNDLTQGDRQLIKDRTSLDRYLWRRWAQKENVAFNLDDAKSFVIGEFGRTGYQVQRRIARGFGYTNGSAS